MNPFEWRRKEQLALILGAVVGIPLGMVLGYFLYAAGSGAAGAISLGSWLFNWSFHPSRFFGWGLFGGVVGASIVYISHLVRSN
jgi:hypothetical protein